MDIFGRMSTLLSMFERLKQLLSFKIPRLQPNLDVQKNLMQAKQMIKRQPTTCFFLSLFFASSLVPIGIFLAFISGIFFFLLSCLLVIQCSVIGFGVTALIITLSGPLCFASLCTMLFYLAQRSAFLLQHYFLRLLSLPSEQLNNLRTMHSGMKQQARGFMKCLPRVNFVLSFIIPNQTYSVGKHDLSGQDRNLTASFDKIIELHDSQRSPANSPDLSEYSSRMAEYIVSGKTARSPPMTDAHSTYENLTG